MTTTMTPSRAKRGSDPVPERARIVAVLGRHTDISRDHTMNGWVCSCGWGKPAEPPPWTRLSHEAFLGHVADMLITNGGQWHGNLAASWRVAPPESAEGPR